MERTIICRSTGDDDPDVKKDSKTSKGNEGVRDGVVDGRHVSAKATGEEEESDLKHNRKTLYKQVERPFLEPIAFALTVSTTLDHRTSSMPQVSVQPLLSQHRDESG